MGPVDASTRLLKLATRTAPATSARLRIPVNRMCPLRQPMTIEELPHHLGLSRQFCTQPGVYANHGWGATDVLDDFPDGHLDCVADCAPIKCAATKASNRWAIAKSEPWFAS